jgi:hypothetical protein
MNELLGWRSKLIDDKMDERWLLDFEKCKHLVVIELQVDLSLDLRFEEERSID